MKRWTRSRGSHLVSICLAAALLLGAGPIPTDPSIPRTAWSVARELGFDDAELEGLLEGRIASKILAEGSNKELALAVAMLVPLSPQRVFDEVAQGQFFAINRTVLQVGELPAAGITASHLEGLQLPAGEIDALRSAESGTGFNLSKAEIARLRSLSGAPAPALLQTYRELLAERARTYQRRGPPHLPPYERGWGLAAYPGEDLRTAVLALSNLERLSPDFYHSLRDFPEHAASGVSHRFFWSVQRIQERPTAVLSHWAMQLRPDFALVVERQFYVGQAYNALQIAGGAYALDETRSLVFYTNRTATDQVTGFASGVARALGQKVMHDEVVALFEAIRDAIAGQALEGDGRALWLPAGVDDLELDGLRDEGRADHAGHGQAPALGIQ